ncbi:MAG: transcription elongation factor subunit Spt4 [Candidatus Micrarchaeota archaeon]
MKACKECRYITYNTADKVCPRCNGELSDKFAGMIIILDPERSEIAKIAELNAIGSYAIRVK